jgi:hypothetical protein
MSAPEITHETPSDSVADPATVRARSMAQRRVLFGVAAAIVLLSCALSLGERPEQVVIPVLNVPLPPLCAMKRYTGVDCPGCGLTRSFIALGHGRWSEALAYNPAGPLWFAIIAGQLPWQWLQLRRLKQGKEEWNLGLWGQAVLGIGMLALIGQWLVRQWLLQPW